MTFICSSCGMKKNELYVGETWIPDDYISSSFWRGEENPLCIKCSLARSKETFYSFENVAQFIKAIGLMENDTEPKS